MWSPDGRQIAARFEGSLLIFDRDGGPPRRTFQVGSALLVSPSWSPDGSRIAATSQNGEVHVWDVRTGGLERTIRAYDTCGFDLSWSPDGRRIAVAGRSPADVRVWVDGQSEPELVLPVTPSTGIERHRMLSWRPDGRRLAVAEPGGLVKIWEIPGGSLALSIDPAAGQTIVVAYSPDGSRIFTASDHGEPRVWDAGTGQPLLSLKGQEGNVLAACWSPAGDLLATAGRDHTLTVWNSSTLDVVAVLRGHTSAVFQVDWGPGESGLASSNEYDETRLWGSLEADRDRVLKGNGHFVAALDWSRDGRLVAGDWNSTAVVWDPDASREQARMHTEFEIVRAVAFSQDGKTLALGGGNRPGEVGIEIREADTGRLVRRFGEGAWAHMLAWSPQQDRLVALCGGSSVWDPSTGRTVRVLSAGPNQHFAALSRDGRRLAISHFDEIQVLDVGTEHPTRRFPHSADVPSRAVRWSPDGRRIAAVSRSGPRGVIDLLDSDTGATLSTLRGHTGMVFGLDWSPDGSRIASCGADGEVKIWSPADGAETLTLRGHTGDVWSVAWSPDGLRLATGGTDRTIHVWDARRGRGLR
ncbi:MAG: WD40 repeat domain-containing protein [Isosphaeraceae bacterium]